jgi:proline iminopeptidase
VDDAATIDDGVGMAREAGPVADAFVEVPGGRLFTRSLGTGRTVIAVHGGPDFDHEYLRPELDVLASAARLVFYDQRGRGRSFAGEVPEVTIASEIADLDAVRAATGADRAVVLGHSWGALVALEYAWTHPDRVSSLVLMNPAPVSSDGRSTLRDELARRRTPAEAERRRALLEDPNYQRGDLALDAEYYRIHFRTTVPRDRLDDVVARLRREFTEAGVVAARAIESALYEETWDRADYDLLGRLRRVDVPALIITSTGDFVPLGIATGIAGALPNADLVVLEDCGHFASLERPERVADLVARSA